MSKIELKYTETLEKYFNLDPIKMDYQTKEFKEGTDDTLMNILGKYNIPKKDNLNSFRVIFVLIESTYKTFKDYYRDRFEYYEKEMIELLKYFKDIKSKNIDDIESIIIKDKNGDLKLSTYRWKKDIIDILSERYADVTHDFFEVEDKIEFYKYIPPPTGPWEPAKIHVGHIAKRMMNFLTGENLIKKITEQRKCIGEILILGGIFEDRESLNHNVKNLIEKAENSLKRKKLPKK